MKHQVLQTIQIKLKLAIILSLFVGDSGEFLASVWQQDLGNLKSWNSAISKYIQLVFCCDMKKLLIFNVGNIYS